MRGIDIHSEGTKQLNITGNYCHYCGKEMKSKNDINEEGRKYEIYSCECENAKYETQLKQQIINLNYNLASLENKTCSQENIYKAELQELNKKYRKEDVK